MSPEDNFATDLRYLRGFIELQDQMESAIIRLQTGSDNATPSVELKQFPYPCYVDDE